MARTHGRIGVSIWSDPDWLALPMHAQWLYMALLSQEDINHAGLIAFTPRRWAQLCADRDPDLVTDALKHLAQERFVVVDTDAERLLVRSFIRNDKVAEQPNTLKNACASVRLVTSPRIRRVLLCELQKLDQDRIARMSTAQGHEPAIAVLRATIEALTPSPDGDHDPTGTTPSDGYGDAIADPIPGDGIGDPLPRTRAGEGEGVSSSLQSSSRSTQQITSAVSKATTDRARKPRGRSPAELASTAHSPVAHRLVEDLAATCNRRPTVKILGQLATEVDALIDEDWPVVDVARALSAWRDKGLGPAALQSVANEVVNSTRAPSPAHAGYPPRLALATGTDGPPRGPTRTPTTTQRVADALSLLRPDGDEP